MKHIVRYLVISAAFFAASGFLTPGLSAQVAHKTKEDAEKSSGQGIVFKIPDKFMRAPLKGFKGMLMLNPDAPAAVVISYPNENESPEDLRNRLIASVPNFFGGSKDRVPEWTSKPIEVNGGDKPGSGMLYNGKMGETQLQLALFQREWKGLTLSYGYFAMRTAKDKDKDVKKYWLDEFGRGVKPFESFWKSFSK